MAQEQYHVHNMYNYGKSPYNLASSFGLINDKKNHWQNRTCSTSKRRNNNNKNIKNEIKWAVPLIQSHVFLFLVSKWGIRVGFGFPARVFSRCGHNPAFPRGILWNQQFDIWPRGTVFVAFVGLDAPLGPPRRPLSPQAPLGLTRDSCPGTALVALRLAGQHGREAAGNWLVFHVQLNQNLIYYFVL